jgi:hypothetical protein
MNPIFKISNLPDEFITLIIKYLLKITNEPQLILSSTFFF